MVPTKRRKKLNLIEPQNRPQSYTTQDTLSDSDGEQGHKNHPPIYTCPRCLKCTDCSGGSLIGRDKCQSWFHTQCLGMKHGSVTSDMWFYSECEELSVISQAPTLLIVSPISPPPVSPSSTKSPSPPMSPQPSLPTISPPSSTSPTPVSPTNSKFPSTPISPHHSHPIISPPSPKSDLTTPSHTPLQAFSEDEEFFSSPEIAERSWHRSNYTTIHQISNSDSDISQSYLASTWL